MLIGGPLPGATPSPVAQDEVTYFELCSREPYGSEAPCDPVELVEIVSGWSSAAQPLTGADVAPEAVTENPVHCGVVEVSFELCPCGRSK